MSSSLLERAIAVAGPERVFAALTPGERDRLRFEWRAWARPEQLPPAKTAAGEDWRTWLVLAGRGFGKTRTGAEWVRWRVESCNAQHVIIAGPTAGDVRDVMVEGESGLLRCSPNWFKPEYEPSKLRVTWPNGAVATLLSADEPERFRGKQGDTVWCDELAAWRYVEAWEQLQFTMRLGSPRFMVTTTPKPKPLIRELIKDRRTAITRGSTFDNASNLAHEFIENMREKYEGTRLGRQELFAEVLDDVEGALWTYALIERKRVRAQPQAFRRVVVAVDPSGSAKATADEAGIVAAGTALCSCNGKEELHAFVLEDVSGRYSPNDMGRRAIKSYWNFEADRLVAEDNFGGKIIEDLVHLIDRKVAYRAVRASRGKLVRAEPVAALYEQGRVHHVGMFAALEDEMCSYTPAEPTSPGRMDALVWALTDLMLGEAPASGFSTLPRPRGRV
jgi:phage terminase large subunit-like protein